MCRMSTRTSTLIRNCWKKLPDSSEEQKFPSKDKDRRAAHSWRLLFFASTRRRSVKHSAGRSFQHVRGKCCGKEPKYWRKWFNHEALHQFALERGLALSL